MSYVKSVGWVGWSQKHYSSYSIGCLTREETQKIKNFFGKVGWWAILIELNRRHLWIRYLALLINLWFSCNFQLWIMDTTVITPSKAKKPVFSDHPSIHPPFCASPRLSALKNKPSAISHYLQDFSSDVFLAALTLDAKHGVVVHLTVGDSIPDRTTGQVGRWETTLSLTSSIQYIPSQSLGLQHFTPHANAVKSEDGNLVLHGKYKYM